MLTSFVLKYLYLFGGESKHRPPVAKDISKGRENPLSYVLEENQ